MTVDVALITEARGTTQRLARTFSLACRLLPKGIRDDVYLLYLVFRTLDDLVDEHDPDAPHRVAAVEAWAAGADAPRTREVEVLDSLAMRHPIPRHALRDFCAGMRFDMRAGANETEADLDRYCYQVAGTVGVTMAGLLGTTDPRADVPAAELGMAMQRTNILRDIDEDLAAGRVYLARETLERCGGSLEPGRRAALLRNQIARTDALYDRGIGGIELLRCGRRAVAASAAMYREILRQIEREGFGERAGRAVVPQRRKIAIAARRAALSR